MNILGRALLIVIIAVSALSISAQELVTNGAFDVNVDHWDLANLVYGLLEHHDLDADGDPSSGSALITNSFPSGASDLATLQCIPVLPVDRDYSFGGTLRIADGATATGQASIQIWFWEDSNCTTVVGSTTGTPPVTTAAPGWNRVHATATAPATAVAARLTLWNSKTDAGGELGVHFDNVTLQPTLVFADGFECGDTTAWSNTVP